MKKIKFVFSSILSAILFAPQIPAFGAGERENRQQELTSRMALEATAAYLESHNRSLELSNLPRMINEALAAETEENGVYAEGIERGPAYIARVVALPQSFCAKMGANQAPEDPQLLFDAPQNYSEQPLLASDRGMTLDLRPRIPSLWRCTFVLYSAGWGNLSYGASRYVINLGFGADFSRPEFIRVSQRDHMHPIHDHIEKQVAEAIHFASQTRGPRKTREAAREEAQQLLAGLPKYGELPQLEDEFQQEIARHLVVSHLQRIAAQLQLQEALAGDAGKEAEGIARRKLEEAMTEDPEDDSAEK